MIKLKNQLGTMGVICLIIIVIILVIGMLAPFIAPHDPTLVLLINKFQPPSWNYYLGTDQLGRCILSRLIFGIQTTVFTALFAMFITIFIGVIIGFIAGYFGGRIDALMMRICDIIFSFPSDIMIISIVGIMGANLFNIIICIALIKWAWYARIIRSAIQQNKSRDYVYFARIHHASFFYIMRKHLLPSIMTEVLALATINIGGVILMISALSFLGFGIQAPIPEWGNMLSEAKDYMITKPYLMLPPGIAITLIVILFNYLGDALQDKFINHSSINTTRIMNIGEKHD